MINPLEDQTERTPSRIGWKSFGALMPGFLLSNLEASLMNVALPTLQQDRTLSAEGLPLEALSWIPMSCQLATVSLALVMGALADRQGRKRVYGMGLATLALAAVLGGLAPNLPLLLVARVLQGVGSAALVANGLAIVAEQFDASVRGRALGIMTATVGVAAIFAPVLGAALASQLGWRAIFWVQLPVAVLGLVQVWRRLPPDAGTAPGAAFPVGSALLFAGTVGALVLSLWSWGAGQNGMAGSGLPGGALSAGLWAVLGGACFVGWRIQERRAGDRPLLPLGGLNATAGRLLLALNSAAMTLGALGFALPLSLKARSGVEGLALGLRILPLPLGVVVGAVLGGHFKDRGQARLPMLGGLGAAFMGLAVHSLASSALEGLGLLLTGVGLGAFSVANNSELVHGKTEGLSTLTGLMGVLRQLGTLLGVALAGALMSWRGPTLSLVWYGLLVIPGLGALLWNRRQEPLAPLNST